MSEKRIAVKESLDAVAHMIREVREQLRAEDRAQPYMFEDQVAMLANAEQKVQAIIDRCPHPQLAPRHGTTPDGQYDLIVREMDHWYQHGQPEGESEETASRIVGWRNRIASSLQWKEAHPRPDDVRQFRGWADELDL